MERTATTDALAIAKRLTVIGILAAAGIGALFLMARAEDDGMALQAGIIALASVLAIFALIGWEGGTAKLDRAVVGAERRYADGPVRMGVLLSITWAIIGFFFGDWAAWQLAFPTLNFDAAMTNFGRIRPAHTSSVIFGFGGNALIATAFYVVQRTCHARLHGDLAPWFVLWGYNLFCLLSVVGYLFGVTQSREYAEPEWLADILLTATWLGFFYVFMMTLTKRDMPHIYVSNWYYMALIIVMAFLHIFNNLSLPVSWFGSKSYSAFSGVQDAMTQWWYGHNAVGFFLTAGFLGMLYYFLPKRSGRPLFSYRLSIIGFWGLVFMYLWVGSHHLHFTAIPDWVQTLGMAFSVVLLVPSWSAAINGIMTLNGAWSQLRTDPVLRFMLAAVCFYGLSTFEGSFLAMKPVNALSHYTDWTVGHVHSGALGWVAFITFGALYSLVPVLWRRNGMYSTTAVAIHFWLALAGVLLYITAMWNSGLMQPLMWRTEDADGNLKYAFIETVTAMHPYYVTRAIGGLLFLLGAIVMAWNVAMTISRGAVSAPQLTLASGGVLAGRGGAGGGGGGPGRPAVAKEV